MPPQQKRAKCHPATAPRARLRPGLAPPQQPHISPVPRRRPPQEMPPELENEGQHVQTVFPPDDALGGPGYFAFNPLAHMTEAHALATPASRARLEAEWGAHWDASKGVLLEKSPSNLLRARFLQALWPDCHFVFIVRHPLAHAYASAAWGTAHAGKGALAPDAVADFVEHWLHAHALLKARARTIRRAIRRAIRRRAIRRRAPRPLADPRASPRRPTCRTCAT